MSRKTDETPKNFMTNGEQSSKTAERSSKGVVTSISSREKTDSFTRFSASVNLTKPLTHATTAGHQSRRFMSSVNASSTPSRTSKVKRKQSVTLKSKKGPMAGITEYAEEVGENLLNEFAPFVSGSNPAGGQVDESKLRWASKFSPAHMYCTMKCYEDILDDIYATKKGDRRRFSPDRENMVIASMKHQQDAAFVTQVAEKEMMKMSTKFTAAMRLLDAHKHKEGLPHTSKQPIMQSEPKTVYQAWSNSWSDEFNFRLKTYRETTSVIDEINEGQLGSS